MKPSLNLTDPLAEQAVTIVVHITPGQNQAERSLLLSLGVPDQLPVQAQGTFADLNQLIRTAWTTFGVQMQTNAAANATSIPHPETDDAFAGGEETEACDAAAETDDITVATAPLAPPASSSPAPTQSTKRPVLEQPTLSLF